MLAIFFNSLAIGYSGAMMPGSLLTYTIEKSAKEGKSAGFIISLGHAFLEFFLVIFLFLGLGQFLTSKFASISIGLIGGGILCFLGISSLKESLKNKPDDEKIKKDGDEVLIKGEKKEVLKNHSFHEEKEPAFLKKRNLFFAGIVLSATNPYFLVWWAAIGLKLLVDAHTVLGIFGIGLFYFGHILADISWYSIVSLLIAKTSQFLKASVYRIIIICLSFVLIFFGARFIYKSLQLIFF